MPGRFTIKLNRRDSRNYYGDNKFGQPIFTFYHCVFSGGKRVLYI